MKQPIVMPVGGVYINQHTTPAPGPFKITHNPPCSPEFGNRPRYSNHTQMPDNRWGGGQHSIMPAQVGTDPYTAFGQYFMLFSSYTIDEVVEVRTNSPAVAAMALLRFVPRVHPDVIGELYSRIEDVMNASAGLNPEFVIKANPVPAAPEFKNSWTSTHAKLEFEMIIDGAGVRATATDTVFKTLLK